MSKPANFSNHISVLRESFFLGKPTWTQEEVPDQTGKVIIVTGGNSGLGKDTVKKLLEKNAKVYILSRSPAKASAAIEELKKETGTEALFVKADLSDLNSVYEAAEQFKRQEQRLDVLYNNAGIVLPADLTETGYDLVFETNVTGHFYLIQLLLPLLVSTAATAPKGSVRIVNLTSCAHHTTRQIPVDYESLRDTPTRQKYKEHEFYNQSKFGNLLVSNELARRYGGANIVSIAVHPGCFETPITTKHSSKYPILIRAYLKFLFSRYPAEYGALSQLWAGTAVEAAAANGKYIMPWAKIGKPRPDSQDENLAAELWTWLEGRVASHETGKAA